MLRTLKTRRKQINWIMKIWKTQRMTKDNCKFKLIPYMNYSICYKTITAQTHLIVKDSKLIKLIKMPSPRSSLVCYLLTSISWSWISSYVCMTSSTSQKKGNHASEFYKTDYLIPKRKLNIIIQAKVIKLQSRIKVLEDKFLMIKSKKDNLLKVN